MTVTLPSPIRDDLYVEPAWLREYIACLAFMPTPMGRGLDEMKLIYDVTDPISHYLRFKPTAVFMNKRYIVLRGTWRERTTDPGETWERGCVYVPRDDGAIYYTPAQLYFVDDFVALQNPRLVNLR